MKNEGFKTFTAIMIALVTMCSALAAWRAAVAANEAGQADFDGLTAAINSEEAQVLNSITVTEHYQAFLAYRRYNELGDKLKDEIAGAPQGDPDARAPLEQLKSDSWGIAYGLQSLFFPSRYLRTDGTYDSQREMDEENAESERQRDVKPQLHFTRADQLRTKADLLVGMLIFFGVSLWMFTCAQIIERTIRVAFAGVGMLFLVGGLAGVLLLEIIR